MTLPIDMKNIYVEYIESLLQNGIKLEEITSLEEFREFRKNNLISFGDAAIVDRIFFGFSGTRWTSAFNYPKENEIINEKLKAIDVGILTFNTTCYCC